tara:strand:+ start:2344 stop:3612 length:1269 start_codon:yes stop_codon:yes gene_type:complete
MTKKIQILFIHQNYPAQFKSLAPYLIKDKRFEVHIMHARDKNEEVNEKGAIIHRYGFNRDTTQDIHPLAAEFETKMIRAESAYSEAKKLKKEGLNPKLIIAHPGWGEAYLLKLVWPSTKVLSYHEFYYSIKDSDIDFDTSNPYSVEDSEDIQKKLIARNAPLLMSFNQSDAMMSPTDFQRKTAPNIYQNKINVIHDGIDTNIVKKYPDAYLNLNKDGKEIRITKEDKIVSFVNRTLEPYRGYHKFINSIPSIQKEHPDTYFILVGSFDKDTVSYGALPPKGESFRDLFLKDIIDEIDMTKVFFPGRIQYDHLLTLFSITSAHIYFTYPFVLSWSMLEAMACEALVIGSSTEPVKELIKHNKNGLLVDFFDIEGLSKTVNTVLSNPKKYDQLKKKARETILKNYDLDTICLPNQLKLIESLIK